jgi:hypothetical protein
MPDLGPARALSFPITRAPPGIQEQRRDGRQQGHSAQYRGQTKEGEIHSPPRFHQGDARPSPFSRSQEKARLAGTRRPADPGEGEQSHRDGDESEQQLSRTKEVRGNQDRAEESEQDPANPHRPRFARASGGALRYPSSM